MVVSTTIHAQNTGRPANVNIDYVLEKTGNGFRAFDVVTDGVGLVDNYQQQFDTIIQKPGHQRLDPEDAEEAVSAPAPAAKHTMKRTILALLVTLAPTLAFAGPPTDAVEKARANETISKQLKAQAPAAQVTTAVNNFIDIDELGKRSMTSHWSSLKPDEQKKFLDKLHALIEANYIKGMQANLNYKVDYVGEATDPSKATSRCRPRS